MAVASQLLPRRPAERVTCRWRSNGRAAAVRWRVFALAALVAWFGRPAAAIPAIRQAENARAFAIRAVDRETGEGVPLVRLRTTGGIESWSDSRGWIAFFEPGLMDRELFFFVDSPGYSLPADGFGFRGVRLRAAPGGSATVVLDREFPAERIYRVTGGGIFRDSELLGRPRPEGVPTLNAGVIGQDSVQAVPFGKEIFWLWGDTTLANYPLGNFRVSAALSPPPGREGFDPSRAVPLRYFLAPQSVRVREMIPHPEPGVVWLFGLLNLPSDDGKPRLLAHYSRHLSLVDLAEHGLVEFDAEAGIFRIVKSFDDDELWRFPSGNAVRHADGDGDYFYFVESFANRRVPARGDALLDPAAYESFAFDEAAGGYRWQRKRPPTTAGEERQLVASGALDAGAARYPLKDLVSGKSVEVHRASIEFNAYRRRWIMIATEANLIGKPSRLGEVWYAESESITGPWTSGVKIASHPHYSFYNPRHHAFMDQRGGRVIYFEGTYTQTFSGSPVATPRYDYNQLMYRLDLARVVPFFE